MLSVVGQHNKRLKFRRNKMTIQTRYSTPLNDHQIRAVAPSVFGAEAHESRSDKYTYLPTIDILTGLRAEGFEVFEAKQSRTLDKAKREYTTHVLKLRHPDAGDLTQLGQERVEIILRNSHDGASSFELSQGVFRLVCSNGLVAGSTQASVRIPHRGDILGQVIEGAYSIVESSKELQSVIQDWKSIQLTQDDELALAHGAAALRFGDNYAEVIQNPARLLSARRVYDRASDLWTTFNRVQENVIKGGIHLGYKNGRKQTARGVTGLDQDLKLNKGLWVLADFLAKAKQGLDPQPLAA
jgi:hypothetical protein